MRIRHPQFTDAERARHVAQFKAGDRIEWKGTPSLKGSIVEIRGDGLFAVVQWDNGIKVNDVPLEWQRIEREEGSK